MTALRSISYRLYARLPIGLNRRALFAWLFIVAVLLSVAFSINHWLMNQYSTSPNANTPNTKLSIDKQPLNTGETNRQATPELSTLDQQALTWEALEEIELVGLVRSSDKQSFAIIRWKEEQFVVANGDKLPGKDGISVHRIHTDSISLQGPWGEKRLGLNGKEVVTTKGTAHIKLPQLRRIILNEPDSITDHIQANANYEQGKLLSLTLNPGQSTALFNKAGLKPGDQLTHINNKPIAELGLTTLPQLMRQESMTLQIMRSGTHHELTLLY